MIKNSFSAQTSVSSPQNSLISKGFIRIAFTLAEVLITLTIIGIVAVMTIPTLVQNYTERANISKLKKVYNTLSNTFAKAISENGTIDTWITGDYTSDVSQDILPIIVPYLKAVKYCNETSPNDCFSSLYKKKWSTTTTPFLSQAHAKNRMMLLSDGTAIKIEFGNVHGTDSRWCTTGIAEASDQGAWSHAAYSGSCAEIFVDLNGKSAPNIDGKDLFRFKIYKDGITPAGRINETSWAESFATLCLSPTASYYVGGCTAWAIMNENMEYLHCNNLSWGGKKTCK